jgi:probable HAF family extracellular repeat protein
MHFLSCLRHLTPSIARTRRTDFQSVLQRTPWPAVRRRSTCRLQLEALEGRCCPSTTYNITDLGTLGGATSQANAINSGGQVVGEAQLPSTYENAFFYSGGLMNGLGALPGDAASDAYALNNLNNAGQVQVVGVSWSGGNGGAYHAFLWQSSTGMMQDLGNLGSSTTVARAIDNATPLHPFQVVGDGFTAAGVRHAWIWQNSAMTDLNSLLPANSGWVLSQALGINDNQQIVGDGVINGQYHAFLWQLGGGAPTDLGVLSGSNQSSGTAVNAAGQVAGISGPAVINGNFHGFLWTFPGPMTDLGAVSFGAHVSQQTVSSYAYALNNASQVQVVGYSTYSAAIEGTLWQNGEAIDLNSLLPKHSGGYIARAYGINDSGWIVGEGQNGSGPHAVLLTPTRAGQAPMAAAIPSLGNMGISPGDLGGGKPGLAGETVDGAIGQAAFNATANPASWGSYIDQTPRKDAEMANTQERLVRGAVEIDDDGEWAWTLDAMLPGAFLTKEMRQAK